MIGEREMGVCFINSGRTSVSTFVFVVPFVLLTSAVTFWFVYTYILLLRIPLGQIAVFFFT